MPDPKLANGSAPWLDTPSPARMTDIIEKPKWWENPTVLFVCMGVLTMSAMIGTYFISQKYDDPMIVITSVSVVAGITTLIGGIIIKSIDGLASANRMKTEFVSIASHQLRTPLSIIKWYVEFLKKKGDNFNSDQKGYIKTIDESNDRMIKLVNDLLDISRAESGRLQIKPEATNLAELCQNAIKEINPLAVSKRIKISIKYDQSIPLLSLDPKRISLAIDNILSNAIKYTPDQGQISVELSHKGRKVLLNVADTGVGIPAADQKKIFRKFFRANNTMKLQTSGTGLGLFITKAVIESHKGSIWFVSKEGEGTTFYVELPIPRK